jgi:hypothetical protein
MNKTLVAAVFAIWIFLPTGAQAVTLSEVENPFDIVALPKTIEVPQTHLGELAGFPIMYEVSLDATSTIQAVLQQQYRGDQYTIPFGLMIVRQSERGSVHEVARFNPATDEWTRIRESDLGLTIQSSVQVNEEVGPGLYRIEVSTPDNHGKYMLALGVGESDTGYFEAVGDVRTIQKFFGYSILKMLTSSLVYYPLGIIFLLFAIQKTWKYRKTITSVA